MVVSLFPFAVGSDPHMLQLIAPGVIWMVALLSVLLSLDRLFRSDLQDGTLEQLLVSPQPLTLLVSAKLLAHWLMSALPIVLLAPILGLLFHLSSHALVILWLSLLLGTPLLILFGAISRALTLRTRGGAILVALLSLPFYVPVLILGAGSVALANQDIAVSGQLAWLAALLFPALTLAPIATAAALRVGV
jgi:heme exporter protein B